VTVVPNPNAPKVLVIATGGTIAGVQNAPGTLGAYRAGTLTAEQITASVPELARYARVETEQFSNVASTLVTPEMWVKLAKRINTVLQRIEETGAAAQQNGTPISFSQVELLRRIARTAANSIDRDERRLGVDVIRRIDDFVQAPPPQAIVTGQGPDAARAITEARTAWRRMSQADALDTMVDRATNSAQGLNASSLRAQARTIANNPNRMRTFDRDIQAEIRGLARGTRGLSTLQTVGQFAPSFSARNLPGSAVTYGAGGALYSGSPGMAALGVGLGATGMAAKTAANRMATGRMSSMANRARGTPEREIPIPQIAAQSAQQALPQFNFPEIDPITGETLIDIGNFEGQPYPIYGRIKDNPGGSLRARSARR
jgi:hypothetical protein